MQVHLHVEMSPMMHVIDVWSVVMAVLQGPAEAVHHPGADALGLAGGGLRQGAQGGLPRQPRHRCLLQPGGGREEVEGPEEPSGGACEFM